MTHASLPAVLSLTSCSDGVCSLDTGTLTLQGDGLLGCDVFICLIYSEQQLAGGQRHASFAFDCQVSDTATFTTAVVGIPLSF